MIIVANREWSDSHTNVSRLCSSVGWHRNESLCTKSKEKTWRALKYYNSFVISVQQERTSAITVNLNVAQSCLSGPTPQARFGRDWPRLRSDYHSNQAANVDLPVVWCMFQRLFVYFQDTGVLIFGGYVLSGYCSHQQISVKHEGTYFRRGTYLRGFTVELRVLVYFFPYPIGQFLTIPDPSTDKFMDNTGTRPPDPVTTKKSKTLHISHGSYPWLYSRRFT